MARSMLVGGARPGVVANTLGISLSTLYSAVPAASALRPGKDYPLEVEIGTGT